MSVDKKDLLTIRDKHDADINFIMATWLRGLRYGNDWFELIESNAYYDNYHKFIENLLAKPNVTVKISCLKEDPEVILGYSVFEGNTAHFVFVKKSWRNIGIAKSLLPESTNRATHITKPVIEIMRRYKISFNPFL